MWGGTGITCGSGVGELPRIVLGVLMVLRVLEVLVLGVLGVLGVLEVLEVLEVLLPPPRRDTRADRS